MNDNLENELRSMFDANPESAAIFNTLLKDLDSKEKKEKPKAFSTTRRALITTYTEIKQITHCTHCGAVKEAVVKLTKTESVPIIDRSGKITIITEKSPAEVHSYTGYCERCKDYIAGLDRKTLEAHYLSLLASYPFPTNPFTANSMFADIREEVRL